MKIRMEKRRKIAKEAVFMLYPLYACRNEGCMFSHELGVSKRLGCWRYVWLHNARKGAHMDR
jgi:hypothetical protein